jgi:hypothetical protein
MHANAQPFLLAVALAAVLTGCGGGGGGGASSSSSSPTPPSAPPDEAKFGDFVVGTGVFAGGAEVDTDVTEWTGARLGEVTFYSTALGMEITARHGDEITSPQTWVFTVYYSGGRVGLRGPRGDVDWDIIDPPSGGG